MQSKELPVVTNGCKGLCCVAFYFGGKLDETMTDKTVVDGEKIKDMLVPLTVEEANERLKRFGWPDERYDAADERLDGHLFTCRHWDEETRLCGIYEERPYMCSEYPYGRPCEYGCSHAGNPGGSMVPSTVPTRRGKKREGSRAPSVEVPEGLRQEKG